MMKNRLIDDVHTNRWGTREIESICYENTSNWLNHDLLTNAFVSIKIAQVSYVYLRHNLQEKQK